MGGAGRETWGRSGPGRGGAATSCARPGRVNWGLGGGDRARVQGRADLQVESPAPGACKGENQSPGDNCVHLPHDSLLAVWVGAQSTSSGQPGKDP